MAVTMVYTKVMEAFDMFAHQIEYEAARDYPLPVFCNLCAYSSCADDCLSELDEPLVSDA